MTRIDRINIYKGRVGYYATYSFGSYDHFDVAVVELCSGSHRGWGETIIQADREDSYRPLLEMAGALVGRDVPGPVSVLPDTLEDHAYGSTRACREALSMALYDLVGRVCHVPASVLLGGAARKRVPAMPCITIAPAEAMVQRAREWTGAGYRHLKIKFRGRREEDADGLKQIRKAVGDDVDLAIDANHGYKDLDEAIRVLEAIEPLNVSVVEDILEGSLDDYRHLRSRTASKVMIDGQAFWPNVLEIVNRDAADVVNLHPRNQGGLDISLWIDAVARARGVETRIGSSHILGIGDAAFQILGSVIALTMPVEDLGPLRYEYHFGSSPAHYPADENRMITRELFPAKNGEIIISDQPGLGVDVDEEKLARITTETITLP